MGSENLQPENGTAATGARKSAAVPASVQEAHDSRAAEIRSGRDSIFSLLLIAVLLLLYHPALHGLPLWDDDAHLTRPGLYSVVGLGRIWFELGATQQYYPMTHSAFWLQHRVWGQWYEGYHLVSIFLHGFAALLLVQILRLLEIRGAWLAAALWALHPVQVESVAWMSELKNTLSAVFYLGAALVYLRFDQERSWRAYFSAFGLFILGLLTKSVIATLPAALLLVFYWKRGKLLWRKDLRPLIPFFAVGIASGLFTAWVERTLVGADGGEFDFSMLERVLIAGRSFWFYPGKLVWPVDLIFIYPRWEVSLSAWRQLSLPILALLLVAMLVWKRKQWGRGPLVAVLYFMVTLSPALGFLNIYPFRFSFVADHFQYLASIGLIVLFVTGSARVFSSWSGKPEMLVSAFWIGLIAVLGLLTWKQSGMYADAETLWRTTLLRNPGCWMARNNLGLTIFNKGSIQEAVAQYGEALRLKPNAAEVHNNLGFALRRLGQTENAMAQFDEALRIRPNYPEARTNLGNTLFMQGRMEEAIAQYHEALRGKPNNLEVLNNLGMALQHQGKLEEAAAQYREALRLNPAYSEARCNLGNALSKLGRTEEAIDQIRYALNLQPANASIQNSLAWLLATAPQASAGDFASAIQLAGQASHSSGGNNPVFLKTLAAAYAGAGDFDSAIKSAKSALQLAEAQSNSDFATELRREIKLYEARHPFEEAR